MVTYQDVKGSRRIRTCISAGHTMLGEIGFTEHGFAHAQKVSDTAAQILTRYGGKPREVELARIAGFMHDIGNMVNRNNHALTGGVIAFQILSEMGMEPEEVAMIVTAIGNHDEGTGNAVSRIAAALILADKSDVRRSRVRVQSGDGYKEDIHDRVNYAVTNSSLDISEDTDDISLRLDIDTTICPVIEYFKIFMTRMFMCKGASEYLGAKFSLVINNTVLM